VKLQNLLEL